MDGLRLDAAGVHGSATITSDVSDILELEVVAGFYDDQGRLLGTGRFVHHLDEGTGHATRSPGHPARTSTSTSPSRQT